MNLKTMLNKKKLTNKDFTKVELNFNLQQQFFAGTLVQN